LEQCLFHTKLDLTEKSENPQPFLIPEQVIEQMQALKIHTDNVTSLMKEILDDKSQKESLLQNNQFIQTERSLSKFTDAKK